MTSADTEPSELIRGGADVDTPTLDTTQAPIIAANSMKTQVLPLVYIQTPSKLPFNSITKTTMVNTVPQLQFATLPPNIVNKNTTNRSMTNQGVILTPVKNVTKAQQLVIHKPNSMQTVTLSGGSYLTMLKKPEPGQKVMIAPMPKVIKNRLPVTVTTNTLQPKIAFMPLTIPPNNESNNKMFNIKISEGHVQEDNVGNDNDDIQRDLVCNEVIDLDSPVKSEKEYELSILEDSNSIQFNDNDKRKFPKHGISILKKHYQGEKIRVSNSNNNPLLDPDPVKLQKRRRKSSFSYRKDYDDMEIVEAKDKYKMEADVTLTKLEVGEEFVKEHKEDFVEVEVIKEKNTDINMNDDFDLQKILKWEEGVGSLPGSDLKFIVNEFNLIEYVTRDEYDKIVEKRLAKVKVKNEFQEELRCIECGCYGLPSEFINTKYCSLDCQESNSKQCKERDIKLKKKKKKNFPLKKTEPEPMSASDDDTSNDNSQDKFSYPWTCSKKGFSWTKYLDHIKAKAAPVKLFKDAFPYNRNGFRPGMKLEGVDPQHPSYFCVLTVSEVCGYRLRLHFDGYPENYDFWVNADSMDIFPVGWCEKHGHVLQAPPGYTSDNFNWMFYLKQTKATAAPKHLFANRAGNFKAICPNGFRVGMKLEAVDKKNTSLVCVASIRDMMDNRILVHFDSWDDIYDYWADPTSPYIHPVGWCDQYGHNLTPPNDYPNPETFAWTKYMKETKSVAAPVRAFKQRPACGFKRGMRLECVDRRVPQLIRVATVDDVRDHQIRIHFDGWPDRYSYWVDDDNENVHPVGWCQKTGHPIETPLTPDDVYDFLECPTVGCRGMGHIQGPKFATHSDQKFCPYAEDNIDIERVLPDRLLAPDRLVEAVVPVSREPRDKLKPRLGRPPKYLRLEATKTEPEDEVKKTKRKYRKRYKAPTEEESTSPKLSKVESLLEDAKIEPATKESWPKHSKFLEEFVEHVEINPMRWSLNRVSEFVSTIPGSEDFGDLFEQYEIDGEAFLSLSQRDLIDILKVKLGPAIKLYNVIVLLRQKVDRVFS